MVDKLAGTKRLAAEEDKAANESVSRQLCVIGIPKYTTEKELYKHIVLPILPNPQGIIIGFYKKAIKETGFLLFSTDSQKMKFITDFHSHSQKLKYHRVKLTTSIQNPMPPSMFKTLEAVMQKCEIRARAEISDVQLGTDDNQVLPWRDIPYKEQLEKKIDTLQSAMTMYYKEMKSLQGGVAVECAYKKIIETDATCLEGYRNKVELTIGLDANHKIDIGFIKGKMETQNICVDSINNYIHVTQETKQISGIVLPIIQSFYEKYGVTPHNRLVIPSNKEKGYWRLLQIRQSKKTLQIMITFMCSKGVLPPDVEANIRTELKAALSLGKKIGYYSIVSLCMIQSESYGVDFEYSDKVEVLEGNDYYAEELLGFKFQVSPLSFLQVNTGVCEKMYEYIRDLAFEKQDKEVIIFDLYCGIGTIGICLSKIASKIVGIEIVNSAIENAKKNAELNGLKEKTEYHCGKVEDLISSIAATYEKQKIVAIVDPPRGGLHKNVMQRIRTCKGLDVLIYVSCNQQSMIRDITYLCRPNQGKIKAPPFTAISYAAADLFPYTPHTECITLLKRLYAGCSQ